MENEILNETKVNVEEDPSKKYLDQILSLQKEIQTNYVPKDKYDKSERENKMLLDTIAEGRAYESASTEASAQPSIEDIANKLYGPGHEKLKDNELISGLFELRDLIKEKHGVDIAIPNGHKYQFDINDLAAADRVEEAFKYCLDASEGDNAVFMREAVRLSGRGNGIRKY